MVPPIDSILVRTTSMPTPRPETLVTAAAVENPGRKISWRMSAGLIRSTSGGAQAALDGLRGTASVSTPLPSSATSTTTWPPS